MFDLILFGVVVVTMIKIADADGQSPWLWGTITFFLCAVAFCLVPLPLIRMAMAGLLSYGLMFGYKVVFNK